MARTYDGWPGLLSFAGHEFRNAITVVAGYNRMLVSGRAGPLNDMQRHLLQESEKSCARMLVLLAEVSQLASIEAGKTTFKSSALDLRRVLTDAIAALSVDPDHPAEIVLVADDTQTTLMGDEPRLKTAFTSVFWALRREAYESNQLLVRYRDREFKGKAVLWIEVAEPGRIDELESETTEAFDEYRGGTGLSLALARRVFEGHGGGLWSPGQDAKAAAVVALPRS
jgi:signal transduction histidine kinase